MLHHIQTNILDRLAAAEIKRYDELKPSKLDGNVFGHHLESLLRDKYIVRSDSGNYSLTQKGKEYIAHRYDTPLR